MTPTGPGERVEAAPHARGWTIALLFARSRGARNLVTLIPAGIVVGLLIPQGWIDVPLRRQVVIGLPPLVCGLYGTFLGVLTQVPGGGMERRRAPRLIAARGAWLLTVACLLELLATVTLYGVTVEGLITSARALALTGGTTLLCSRYLPVALSWAPAFTFLTISATFGTRDTLATPESWALLQQYPDSLTATVVAALLATAGATAYIRHDNRGEDSR